ncbi:hypothetical protein E2562_001116 [Oryza meyeriana var. granulata]|uniref:DUF4219 domain-containing protein n=1 Tax=Oryza meyeriana var. granulata TaxID=110450 RepID=A0A6G1EE66_9ORYZ|nr:hypothetical protein E2562_001116 [Oryza meyeriana var. granulata]
MPHNNTSSGKAIVSNGLGNSTAVAMTGRLPFPMLPRTNYVAWAMRMKFLLRANGAWGVVDRGKAPVDKAMDQLALSIISQSVNDETLLRVLEKETTYDVWAALRSIHVGVERVREARVQSLRADLDNFKMSDAESVDDYAVKFMTLVGHIRELGDAVEEKYVVKKLPQFVSTKFINVASAMMLFGDTNKMAMEEAIGSLKAHEELLKGREERSEEQLLMARGQDSTRGDEAKETLHRPALKRLPEEPPTLGDVNSTAGGDGSARLYKDGAATTA